MQVRADMCVVRRSCLLMRNRRIAAGPWRVARVNASSIGSWQLRGAPIHAFAAVVFYPCAERNCGAVAANPADAAGRWPVVVFGPGWQSWALRYERTLRHLASHGMVVLAPTTNDGRIVPHAWQFAQTMLAALQFAAAESARPGSLLESRVDSSRAGAFGHSLGGGSATTAAALANNVTHADWLGRVPRPDWPWGTASLLDFSAAADSPAWPNLRALVTLGLAPISAPLPAVSALRARTLFLVAEEDRYIYPSVQRAYFAALPASTPRTLAVLRQGTHCFLDEPQAAHWGLPASQCEMARADPARFLMPEAQARRRRTRRGAAWRFASTFAALL
jgi:dienelactone hydrolase